MAGPDPSLDTSVGPDRQLTAGYPGTPRWVKVSGIIALVLVLLVIIMMVGGAGDHGPGRHLPSGGAGGHTPSIAHMA